MPSFGNSQPAQAGQPVELTGRDALALVEDLDVVEDVIAPDESPPVTMELAQARVAD